MNGTLTDTTTSSQIEPKSNGNEPVLYIENWFYDEVILPNDNASCHRVKRIKAFFFFRKGL